jgi:hypothetical protein
MGHTTVNIDFTAAEADSILAAGDRSDVRYFGLDGMWRPNSLVTAAVARWRDSEDAYGDENSGPATTLPLATPRTINGALPHGSQTFILPVCADADVIRKTVKVRVTGTPKEMAALRARHVDGHDLHGVAAVRTALEQFGATVEQVKVVSVSAPGSRSRRPQTASSSRRIKSSSTGTGTTCERSSRQGPRWQKPVRQAST